MNKEITPTELPALPSMPSDEQEVARTEAIDQARRDREAKEAELTAAGYTLGERGSIMNSGYVNPEVYANSDPSVASLESMAKEENRRNAERVMLGEDISIAPAGYQQERQHLVDHYANSIGFTPDQVERVVSAGHGRPETYDPHFAENLLADRLAAEPTNDPAKTEVMSA